MAVRRAAYKDLAAYHGWACSVLKQDARIRADAFTEQFTVECFADVLFSLMLSALLRKDYDPTAVLEIVSRTLYQCFTGWWYFLSLKLNDVH